jgi:hypothetical protein
MGLVGITCASANANCISDCREILFVMYAVSDRAHVQLESVLVAEYLQIMVGSHLSIGFEPIWPRRWVNDLQSMSLAVRVRVHLRI